MRFTYTGDTAVTYSMYLDVTDPEQVTTLVAESGKTYEIKATTGYTLPGEPDKDGNRPRVPRELPMPPDGRWKAVKAAPKKDKET